MKTDKEIIDDYKRKETIERAYAVKITIKMENPIGKARSETFNIIPRFVYDKMMNLMNNWGEIIMGSQSDFNMFEQNVKMLETLEGKEEKC